MGAQRSVSLESKQQYIRWFMSRFALKRRDSRVILSFLLENEDVLSKVTFVENLSYLDNALLISAKGSTTYPFMFRYRGEFVYSSLVTLQRLVDLSDDDSVYVWLAYDPMLASPDAGDVVQENPVAAWRSQAQRVARLLVRSVEDEMSQLVLRKGELERLVDLALEQGDRDAFLRHTGELFEIEKRVS